MRVYTSHLQAELGVITGAESNLMMKKADM